MLVESLSKMYIHVVLATLVIAVVPAMSTRSQPENNAALILIKEPWAVYRELPEYQLHTDPLRKNLVANVDMEEKTTSCHYYGVMSMDPCYGYDHIEHSMICVECTGPSDCTGKDAHHFRLITIDAHPTCRGRWKKVWEKNTCTGCDRGARNNYIFI